MPDTNREQIAINEIAEDMNLSEEVVEEYYSEIGMCPIEDDGSTIRDAYRGSYKTMADYAREHCESMGDIGGHWIESYIDYESMGSDMEHDLHVIEGGAGVCLFYAG